MGDIFGGGGDTQPAPDNSKLAAASDHAAELGKELGDAQLAENKRQYDQNYAAAQPIVQSQTALMKQQTEQGNDYYNYMKQFSRPDEQSLFYEAMGFNPDEIAQVEASRAAETQATPTGDTPNTNSLVSKLAANAGLRQQNEAADTAIADTRKGFTSATNNAIRNGLRYGFSADKIAAANANMDTQQATAEAAAATGARDKAKNLSYAKKLDVAGLYRGLPGASQAAYDLTVNAGNSAVNNTMAPSSQYVNGINQGNATILTGTGQQINGLSNILNAQTSYANSYNNSNAGDSGIFGALGQIGGAAITQWSDENLKEGIKPVSEDDALKAVVKTPVKSWKYDQDKLPNGDTDEHIGAMAQDVNKNMGDAAAPGGRMIDLISMNGITMSAIQGLAKKVDKLEKKGARK